jgi:hypothetical protein
MQDFLQKSNKNENQSIADDSIQTKSNNSEFSNFEDNSPEAIQMREFQDRIDGSDETEQLRSFDNSAQKNEQAQLQEEEKAPTKQKNNTGLPDDLKIGIENLSGISLDDVKVHRNSDKPAQLQAHAYAEGTDIYLGPGQEEHLPHEAWHVVQQKQGRVKPTMQMEDMDVNDDINLETEADVMGGESQKVDYSVPNKEIRNKPSNENIIQGHFHSKRVSLTKEKNKFEATTEGSSVTSSSYAAFGPIDNFIKNDKSQVTKNQITLNVGHLVKKEYGGLGDIPNVLPWGEKFEHGVWDQSVEAEVSKSLEEISSFDDVDLVYIVDGEDSDSLVTAAISMLESVKAKLVKDGSTIKKDASDKIDSLIAIADTLSQIPETVNVKIKMTPRSVYEDPYSGERTYQDTMDGQNIGYKTKLIVDKSFGSQELKIPLISEVISADEYIEAHLIKDSDNEWIYK